MKKKLRALFSCLGPGLITGASDDDPSGIGTYAQTGSLFGYTQLWTSLWIFPFMTVVQEMCGRIGLVTGKGLSGVIRKHYSKKALYIALGALVIANTVNIGADLGAMAESARLIFNLPFGFWLITITALTLLLEVFISYKIYAKFLKFLTLSLFAYVINVFLIKQDWVSILYHTIIPTFSTTSVYITNLVAVLGTTISPYLFFWQSNEEVEEEIAHHKLRIMGIGLPRISVKDIKKMQIDTTMGMLFSNLIMFFIIASTGSTLHKAGITNIETPYEAALALKPLAGDTAFIVFTLGIIGTGLLAVPILAGSAAYALSEAFGWKEGLYRKFTQAHGFYGVITIATLFGLLINFIKIKPFVMLYYTAVINGLISPILLVYILAIANNKKIMGSYTNSRFSNIMGAIITAVFAICGLFLLFLLITNQ